MAADENGGGGADARLSVQHIVQRPFALGSGGCRSGAASLSGGKSGRCRAAAGPLHSPPPFNGAAAVKCSLCCLQVLLFLLAWLRTRTEIL